MNRDNIYSARLRDEMTYLIPGELLQIFDSDLKNLLSHDVPFELGGDRLLFIRNNLEKILLGLLPDRAESKHPIPPNYVESEVLGQNILLNIREDVDDKLFWFGGLHRLINDAVIHNYYLKFIPNDGTRFVDNTIPVELKIN